MLSVRRFMEESLPPVSATRPPPQTSRALLLRLMREHVRPYLPRFALAVLMMMLVAGTTAALAKLIQPVLDDVFTNKDRSLLWEIGGLILFTFLVKGLASYGESVVMNTTGQRIISDIQQRLFAHVVHADLAFFHGHPTGTLVSRFTNDVGLMRNLVSSTLTGLGKDVLGVIFLVAVMVQQDWVLTLVAFVGFPTAILPIARLGKRMRKVSANTQVEMGQFTTLLEQVFMGARHVKSYAMEGYETGRAATLINRLHRLIAKASRVRAISSPVMETLGGVAIVAVIVYGGSQVIDGTRTTGTFFSFITALLLAYEPIKRLANLNVSMQEGLAAADRVFTLIDTPPAIADAPGAPALAVARGEVRFEGVRFHYADPEAPQLDGLDLVIPAGQKVALVGPSGAGKSTILNLIPRFYDVTAGRILIDGQAVQSVTLGSLRRSIGLVSQEVSLFDDSVRANIAYGRPEASEAEIIQAARDAAAHEFITELPQGYDTVVGEFGVKLSGGQRQRLSIARAMLKNAPILLLDEATSALDTESERLVQAALDRLMQGRTVLVIAHRLSTVVDADLIYVLERGKVVERGSHAELLARTGLYARLHALQFAEPVAG
jgi:subfamily B ATP-binding cassette protein MsbA